MPVHAGIERFIRGFQVVALFGGLVFIALGVALDATGVIPSFVTYGGVVPIGVAVLIVLPVGLSPRVRRASTAWLGRLVSRGEERQAAAVSALMGEYSAAKALAVGKATFTGLPFSKLTSDDLSSNKDTGLNERIVHLKLGECDAFMSHSWHDDPVIKWAALTAWAARFESRCKRDPTIWLDKACIDQKNIPASLACLPVFLAGCQQLLVLAGPTYIERLWCVVEVFTFTRMGGELDRVDVVPLGDGALFFEQFSVQAAKCFLAEDKGRLLAAIESAFGSHEPFNALVRSLLVSASSGAKGKRDDLLSQSV